VRTLEVLILAQPLSALSPEKTTKRTFTASREWKNQGRFQVKGLDLGPLFIDGQHDAVVRMRHA
jgi:hypothetical protein